MSTGTETGLHVEGATLLRAGFPVVREVNLVAPAGQVTVLLGPNGAGKTTLLEAISGVIPVASGSVRLGSTPIHKLARDQRVNLGLAHVEQGRSIFPDLTTEENLLVAAPPRFSLKATFELFPSLYERKQVMARYLSGGEQQMLVLARALVRNPSVLLVDEMSLGLAPIIVRRLLPVITEAARRGVAVLLVEQFANLALSIGTRAYVLNHGRIVLESPCPDLAQHPERLRQAYLVAV